MHSVLQYSYNNGEWYVPVFFCNCDYGPLLKMKTCNASKQPPSGEKEKYRTSLTMVTIFLQRRPISIISDTYTRMYSYSIHEHQTGDEKMIAQQHTWGHFLSYTKRGFNWNH